MLLIWPPAIKQRGACLQQVAGGGAARFSGSGQLASSAQGARKGARVQVRDALGRSRGRRPGASHVRAVVNDDPRPALIARA